MDQFLVVAVAQHLVDAPGRQPHDAARLAAHSGANTVIVGGRAPNVLLRVAAGEEIGTFLHTSQQPIAARKQWLAGHLQVRGRLVLDEGAVRVLRESGRSLLPVGVLEVSGEFTRGELVLSLIHISEPTRPY